MLPEEALTMFREHMVEFLHGAGITDDHVLDAMERVPRHRFAPPDAGLAAYEETALVTLPGVHLPSPLFVATALQALALQPGDRVLEVGTGVGYTAAVLSTMGARVYSLELDAPALEAARDHLDALALDARLRLGDGLRGWPEQAPFDAIVLSGAVAEVPEALFTQLGPGGRLAAAVGTGQAQKLTVWTASPGGPIARVVTDVAMQRLTST